MLENSSSQCLCCGVNLFLSKCCVRTQPKGSLSCILPFAENVAPQSSSPQLPILVSPFGGDVGYAHPASKSVVTRRPPPMQRTLGLASLS
jgi:hypothetical protein